MLRASVTQLRIEHDLLVARNTMLEKFKAVREVTSSSWRARICNARYDELPVCTCTSKAQSAPSSTAMPAA